LSGISGLVCPGTRDVSLRNGAGFMMGLWGGWKSCNYLSFEFPSTPVSLLFVDALLPLKNTAGDEY